MSNPKFPLHTRSTAPAAAKPALENLEKTLGFIPNLYAHLAEAPAALLGYLTLGDQFKQASLNAVEQQVVLISASIENGCDYCTAAHSFLARNLVKADGKIIDALRAQRDLPDARLNALARFTREMVKTRGRPAPAALFAFYEGGFDQRAVLEVITGIALKTLSNYMNHLTHTPLDAMFEPERWHGGA
jgi:AhpD family alkylhydroperoxidase